VQGKLRFSGLARVLVDHSWAPLDKWGQARGQQGVGPALHSRGVELGELQENSSLTIVFQSKECVECSICPLQESRDKRWYGQLVCVPLAAAPRRRQQRKTTEPPYSPDFLYATRGALSHCTPCHDRLLTLQILASRTFQIISTGCSEQPALGDYTRLERNTVRRRISPGPGPPLLTRMLPLTLNITQNALPRDDRWLCLHPCLRDLFRIQFQLCLRCLQKADGARPRIESPSA
jgi:hypothetical protein